MNRMPEHFHIYNFFELQFKSVTVFRVMTEFSYFKLNKRSFRLQLNLPKIYYPTTFNFIFSIKRIYLFNEHVSEQNRTAGQSISTGFHCSNHVVISSLIAYGLRLARGFWIKFQFPNLYSN